MIVHQKRSRFSARRKWKLAGIAAVPFLVALLFFAWRARTKPQPDTIFVDMEEILDKGKDGIFFVGTEDVLLGNGGTQSDAVARSGKFSCGVNASKEFGMTYERTSVNGGDEFICKIWKKSDGEIGKLVVDASWEYYAFAHVTGKKDRQGWEELLVHFKVPNHVRDGKFKVYAWNPTPETAFFDDFEIRLANVNSRGTKPVFKPGDSLPSLNLIISDKGMEKLRELREEAFRVGLLQLDDDAWVKTRLVEDKHEWRGALRLKGDWTDHLQGDKWSYRVNLLPGQAWRRMTSFSLQSPERRSNLDEWVYHKWMEQEDILCPRYDFIELKINGVSKGVYAYEEHFEDELVEHRGRRDGPIMKFNEEGFWEIVEKSIAPGAIWFDRREPYIESSTSDAFSMNRVMDKNSRRNDFSAALSLMDSYQKGQKTVWDIFDVEQVAKYYAIMDIAQAYHGLVWHNQRWYYNPTLSKLEPIGFDGYTPEGALTWLQRPFMGHGRNTRYVNPSYGEQMFSRFFEDEKFLALYVRNLWKYSDPEYLKAFYAKIERGLAQREAWIQAEQAKYRYNAATIFNEALTLRQTLLPLQYTSVKAHLQGKVGLRYSYNLFNYHCLPVKLLGVGETKDKMDAPFEEQVFLPAYVQEYPAEFIQLYSTAPGQFVFFSIPGIDSTFSVAILQWESPPTFTEEQALFQNVRVVSNAIYKVDSAKRHVRFAAGAHRVDRDMAFPEGWTIEINPGVELDFVNGAKFVSKSPVIMLGTEEKPIRIRSSDQSAQGFTILKADGKCTWRNVVFDGFKALNAKGWKLEGSVTLYESEVDIRNCRFVNADANDALNIVRSIFDIRDTYVGYAKEDGIDVDASKGQIIRTHIFKAGKDGIETSDAYVTIEDCIVEGSLENGLNAGRESKVLVKSITAKGNKFGLASKDLSELTIQKATITGSETALVAYQQRAEYGPAKIIAKQYEVQDCEKEYLLQEGSELHVNGQVIKGKL